MINIFVRGVLRLLVFMYFLNLIVVKVVNGINVKKEILKEMRFCVLVLFLVIFISGRSVLKIFSIVVIIVVFFNKLVFLVVNFFILYMEYFLVIE